MPGSSGCCSRRQGVDRCGYDNALVWTNNEGGLQLQNELGRLNSDSPMKNVTQVTVDLGKLQLIRGVQIQGVCDCDDVCKNKDINLHYLHLIFILVVLQTVVQFISQRM